MLIPRKLLFGNPTKANPQISPDGAQLAYIAPDASDILQVWVQTLGRDDDRQLTNDQKRGIRAYFWTFDGEQLIYLQDSDGDENWHLYAVNTKKDVVRDLTPFQGVQAQMVALSHRRPGEALVGMNLDDRRKHDVYRVNLTNGAVEPDTENPGDVVGWVADDDLEVRAALALDPMGGGELRLRESSGAEWQAVRQWGPDDEVQPVHFSEDGRSLYILSNQEAPATRLLRLDLDAGAETVVAEDARFDVSEAFVHPISGEVQAAGFTKERLEWQVIDASIAEDFEAIGAIRDGDMSIHSRALDDSTWIVSCLTDDGPVYSYAYHPRAKRSTLLFSNRPELEGLPLAKMRPVSFAAKDGLLLSAYLTLPAEAASQRDLPAVLLVHGGPWARDVWGFDPEAQWLANRGYAVLQVNFRGSTGYGRELLNAGNREWAAKMHQDLVDGVEWLVGEGIADRKRVAIMGGSYGGYATLAGLTFTPELFAAGVDIVGPSNLMTLIASIPPYWAPMLGLFKHRVGDPDTEAEFLNSISPVNFADRIRSPLLVAQGANDPRVKEAESEQIVEAMKRAGLPVEYVVYTDEGHGFARPENRLHFFAVAEEFLAKHLGGDFEPMGEIEGHSAVVK